MVYFFLHIPKTAGTTVRAHLERDFFPGAVLRVPNNEGVLELRESELQAYSVISGHQFYPFKDLLSHPVRVVTLLREPIARVLSAYEYIKRTSAHPLHALFGREGVESVATFCSHPSFCFHARDMQTRMLGVAYPLAKIVRSVWRGELHAHDGAARMREAEGAPCTVEMLTRAEARLESAHFVGLSEDMLASLELLTELLGRPRPPALLHLNAAPLEEGHRRLTAYSEAELAAVREANRFDIDLYSFAARLFARRYASRVGQRR
jgi:hypothetical protein